MSRQYLPTLWPCGRAVEDDETAARLAVLLSELEETVTQPDLRPELRSHLRLEADVIRAEIRSYVSARRRASRPGSPSAPVLA